MPPTAAETTDAILRNARAQERARLRNVARKRWPDATEDQLDDHVRELTIEKLREAGKLGRASQQRMSEAGKLLLAAQPHLIGTLEDAIAIVRAITADEDQAA